MMDRIDLASAVPLRVGGAGSERPHCDRGGHEE